MKKEENNKKSLLEEACRVVYLNFGNETAQLYKAGLKDKAEKEILASLESSLNELVGPEHAKQQIAEMKMKYNNNNNK